MGENYLELEWGHFCNCKKVKEPPPPVRRKKMAPNVVRRHLADSAPHCKGMAHFFVPTPFVDIYQYLTHAYELLAFTEAECVVPLQADSNLQVGPCRVLQGDAGHSVGPESVRVHLELYRQSSS